MMKAADFRKMALGFDGAVEGSHMGHADFRAGGKKIFATLNADETRGMVALTPEAQKACLHDHPDMFVPASGAWGLQGSTMVELAAADEEVVGEAMTVAWQRANQSTAKNARQSESTKPRKPKAAKPRKAKATKPRKR